MAVGVERPRAELARTRFGRLTTPVRGSRRLGRQTQRVREALTRSRAGRPPFSGPHVPRAR